MLAASFNYKYQFFSRINKERDVKKAKENSDNLRRERIFFVGYRKKERVCFAWPPPATMPVVPGGQK
jgi:hypothetical protein